MTEKVPILVVDHLPQNIMAIEAIIAGKGFDVITASSGNDALRLSLNHDFALILLDVQMPGKSGLEVARLIRANPKTHHFPIIFVTDGMRDLLTQIEGYETGAVDYLIKPFEPVILRSKVQVFRELHLQRKVIERFYSNLEQLVEERTAALQEANRTISHQAATDDLTDLYNRRYFNECLIAAISAARRHAYPLSLIMIDLDNFKKVNDTHGHSAGDLVLKSFASLLQEMIRTEDVAARWGGEEFIVLLSHTTCDAAAALAERIRTAFEQQSAGGLKLALSASFGVIQLEESDDADTLIRRADAALYQAKHEGRNRVVTVRG
jgi:diguanylate cyclase (GGDEF)-like protein